MNEEIKLKRAIKATKGFFNQLATQYDPEIAKKALYRVARDRSEYEKLLLEKEELDQKMRQVKEKIDNA